MVDACVPAESEMIVSALLISRDLLALHIFQIYTS